MSELLDKISNCGQERYEVTSEEAKKIVDEDIQGNGPWVYCSRLPKECQKIPGVIGCLNGVLVIEKPKPSIKDRLQDTKIPSGIFSDVYQVPISDSVGKYVVTDGMIREIVDYAWKAGDPKADEGLAYIPKLNVYKDIGVEE